jgi:hypothetical protein
MPGEPVSPTRLHLLSGGKSASHYDLRDSLAEGIVERGGPPLGEEDLDVLCFLQAVEIKRLSQLRDSASEASAPKQMFSSQTEEVSLKVVEEANFRIGLANDHLAQYQSRVDYVTSEYNRLLKAYNHVSARATDSETHLQCLLSELEAARQTIASLE